MDKTLFEAAKTAQPNAYTPYSNFNVGAALRDDQGRMHVGVNVENAAYPEGTCAEAGAISAMVLAGGRKLKELVVIGDGDGLVTPCGGCRQKIREFAAADTQIHVCGPEGLRRTFTLDELLPASFGPENLDKESQL